MPGSPKSLREAIQNGISAAENGSAAETIEAHVRDYLSQKFQVPFHSVNQDTVEAVQKLWNKITVGDAE